MATDKTGTWSDGDSVLWYTPASGLDTFWNDGENCLLDEYIAAGAQTYDETIPEKSSIKDEGKAQFTFNAQVYRDA